MKHKHHQRRGSVIIPLVLLGVLAIISTVTLKQLFWDRSEQESRLVKIQLNLLQSDVVKESFRKQFKDSGQTMTAIIDKSFFRSEVQYKLIAIPNDGTTEIIVKIEKTEETPSP